MSEHESGFTSEGYESFPDLYFDTQRLHDVADWSDEMLAGRLKQYSEFLSRPNLMPRAQETASRTFEHMMFELVQREDHDTHLTDKDYEELLNV